MCEERGRVMKLETIQNKIILDKEQPQPYFYLIVDGIGVKKLTQRLWMYDNDSKMLFDEDKASAEVLELSPYLIQLTKNTKELIQKLIVEYYGEHTLLFAYSYVELEPLTEHLQSHVMYEIKKDEKKEEVYVAFYDPRVLPSFLEALEEDEKEAFLSPFVAIIAEDERDTTKLKTFKGQGSKTIEPYQEEILRTLTPPQIEKLEAYEEQRSYFKMAKALKNIYPNELHEYTLDMLEEIAQERTKKMRAYGLDKYNQHFQLFAWEVFYGEDYEKNDESGVLLDILKSNLSSNEKFKKYKETFSTHYSIGDA